MLYDPKWEKPVTAPVEEWQAILLDAAARIRTHGWCQGNLEDGARRCAIGAMIIGLPSSAQSAFHIALDKLERLVGLPVTMWNDSPDRTAPMVITALERAARS